MIRNTAVIFEKPSWRMKVFTKWVAENGLYVCTVDNRIVTPEEGNEEFAETVNTDLPYKIKTTEVEANNEQILDIIRSRVDKYVDYIDDYRQYRAACARNQQWYDLRDAFMDIMYEGMKEPERW